MVSILHVERHPQNLQNRRLSPVQTLLKPDVDYSVALTIAAAVDLSL
jgi:hypothetical protein